MRTEMTKTDIVFQVLDWLEAGVYFDTTDIMNRCQCSRITASRSIQYLREKRHMVISYDRFKRVYILGEYQKQTKAEIDRRTRLKNQEKISYKKHLKYIFGEDWKKHYNEGDENVRS